MRLEIGAGEKPHPDYDLHVDMLPLPGIKVLVRGRPAAVRHRLDRRTARQPRAGAPELRAGGRHPARVDPGAPPGREGRHRRSRRQVRGRAVGARRGRHRGGELLDPRWALRPEAHKGHDERGVPLWIWNAHHTMFDAESLRAAVEPSTSWSTSSSPTTSATSASTLTKRERARDHLTQQCRERGSRATARMTRERRAVAPERPGAGRADPHAGRRPHARSSRRTCAGSTRSTPSSTRWSWCSPSARWREAAEADRRTRGGRGHRSAARRAGDGQGEPRRRGHGDHPGREGVRGHGRPGRRDAGGAAAGGRRDRDRAAPTCRTWGCGCRPTAACAASPATPGTRARPRAGRPAARRRRWRRA